MYVDYQLASRSYSNHSKPLLLQAFCLNIPHFISYIVLCFDILFEKSLEDKNNIISYMAEGPPIFEKNVKLTT